jgi:hypothetical protein
MFYRLYNHETKPCNKGRWANKIDILFMKVSRSMNLSNITYMRLISQQLTGTKLITPKQVVSWMGAMQAQDFPMSKWAIGVRLPGSTDQLLEAAITDGEIIRTHLLRPTWHYAAADDIYWLLDLTAPQIKAAQSSRDRDLELTEAVYSKSNAIIEKALNPGRHLIREELIAELNKGGIDTKQNRAAHLFARAELEKIICSGATRNGKTTYALFSKRVRNVRQLSREEALAELGRRYFTSRCPASLQDFTWWSGLPARDANHALELVKLEFTPETINGHTYWLTPNYPIPGQNIHSVYLLPTYDEYIISYADRSASIPASLQQHMKEISDRGVFRPVIVVNGQVAGIWKRTIQKDTMLVEILPFTPADQVTMELMVQTATQYGHFSGKRIELKR